MASEFQHTAKKKEQQSSICIFFYFVLIVSEAEADINRLSAEL